MIVRGYERAQYANPAQGSQYGDLVDDIVGPLVARIESKLQPKADAAVSKIAWWAVVGGIALGVTSAYVTFKLLKRRKG